MQCRYHLLKLNEIKIVACFKGTDKLNTSKAKNSFAKKKKNKNFISESNSDNSDFSDASNDSTFKFSSTNESENSYDVEYSVGRFKKISYEVTLSHIKNNPKTYIGFNEKWFKCNFIQLISSQLELDERSIYITLMKIKLNDSFKQLGDMFGISESVACKLFHKALPKITYSVSVSVFICSIYYRLFINRNTKTIRSY